MTLDVVVTLLALAALAGACAVVTILLVDQRQGRWPRAQRYRQPKRWRGGRRFSSRHHFHHS